jgi:hypothetical protein
VTTEPTFIAGFDAVNIDHIPPDAKWVAGYIGGQWPTFVSLKKRFPKARRVSIAVEAIYEADVLDVERYDATPAEAPGWVTRMRAKGRIPVVYCNKSTLGAVEAAFQSAHVAPPFYWVADWTAEAHMVSGSVATQWANGSPEFPGLAAHADTSLVSPNFPLPFVNKKGGTGVNIPTPSKQQVVSVGHELAGVAAILASVSNNPNLSPALRGVLAAVGGLIVAVERFSNQGR